MSLLHRLLASHSKAGTSSSSTIFVASAGFLTAAAATTVCSSYLSDRSKTSLLQNQQQQSTTGDRPFQIETDLMQHIAQKPYLQAFTSNEQYPRGVPHRLRILAIDVPDMRQAFDGDCRINLSKSYDSSLTVPPKLIMRDYGNSNYSPNDSDTGEDNRNHNRQKQLKQKQKISISQKSLVKSLIKCRKNKRIGVELMEASIEDLNPHNMRRTHQFGSLLKYDPGKYATQRRSTNRPKSHAMTQHDEPETKEHDQGTTPHISTGDGKISSSSSQGVSNVMKDTENGKTVAATIDDEIDAPWNQYAWIEEMQLRIHGKVPFGSTLTSASSIARILNGNVYKPTVPSSRALWEYFLPSILHRDPAGQEGMGNRHNWASHKPHAVVADGAAMQRVPGSMKFLQRTCQEADVPLFIVNDPRVWGGNTHQDLEDALKDLRKTVKYRIVQQSMRGSAFSRGRLLGQFETEAKWQVKDMSRRTREAIKDATRQLQHERTNDWSDLDQTELEQKLAHHGVIHIPKEKNGVYNYTDGMKALARRCVESLIKEQQVTESKQPREQQVLEDGTGVAL